MPFCGKCGTEYEEGGSCPICTIKEQASVSKKKEKKNRKNKDNSEQQQVPAVEQGQETVQKKKKITKAKVIFMLIVLTAIVITGVVFFVLYTRPLQPINKIMNSFNKKENFMEYAFSSYPKEWQKHVSKFDDIYEDRYEGDTDSMEVLFENLDDTYPNWKLRFEQTSAITAMDADEVEDAEDSLKAYFGYLAQMLRNYEESDYDNVADAYDLSDREASKFIESMLDIYDNYEACEITKGYIVKGRYIFTYKEGNYESGEEKELKSDRAKFYVVQVNGDWVIANVEYDSQPFATENVWNTNYSIPMQLYQTLYSQALN